MNRNWMKFVLRAPDEVDGGGNGGAPAVVDPAPVPAPPAAAAVVAPDPAAAPASKGTEGGYWPDDWRETASKGDAKLAARFSRYANPDAALTALIAAQNRISSGELKPVLGKDASAEELKAWRAEQGIPESADKYDLGKDFNISAEDKPLVDEFLKAAHLTNQTPDQVKAAVKAYYDVNTHITEQRTQRDQQAQLAAEETLRAEWGPEFRRDINLIHGLLDKSADKDLKESFLGGRLADGTPIGSSPAALKFLLSLALVDNPAGTVVPNSGGNVMQSVDDEISKIEKGMRENRAEYNKNEGTQQRYRELLGVRETMKSRNR
jgi:hypothetical protein